MQSVPKIATCEQNGADHFEETYKLKLADPVDVPYLKLKRVFDLFFALILSIVALPIIGIAAIAIKMESAGPVFFHQVRVGLMGKRIVITKLRSMRTDAEKDGAQWASKNDARITRVGKFIRKTRIDELPQLFSVIKGDISLIGPRPERPEFTQLFSKKYPGFEQRLLIKPGLSGYAQVHGGYEIDPGQKAALDMKYIKNVSLAMDARIFLRTIFIVISGDGAR
ncbi:sugar transferase [Lacticaseibacillus zhaodongensis]|uniref:sugar transferase n=1 Tax=Lacticaseibacillus zhaodongensis TaxID=2668065 RepID=UPI001E42F0CD|nr:sugar transferase [Lacticaseibacillus zhaodongensis]